MTQQKAGYPRDYSHGGTSTKDRPGGSAQKSGEDLAAKAAERVPEFGEMAQDAAKKFKSYVEQSMKEKPMATLAAAAAIAFVLGALWRK